MNSRRSFFKQLLMGAASFAILPPATTYERLWKAQRQIVLPPQVNCDQFIAMLVKEVPKFDALILKDFQIGRPTLYGKWESIAMPDEHLIKACDFLG